MFPQIKFKDVKLTNQRIPPINDFHVYEDTCKFVIEVKFINN